MHCRYEVSWGLSIGLAQGPLLIDPSIPYLYYTAPHLPSAPVLVGWGPVMPSSNGIKAVFQQSITSPKTPRGRTFGETHSIDVIIDDIRVPEAEKWGAGLIQVTIYFILKYSRTLAPSLLPDSWLRHKLINLVAGFLHIVSVSPLAFHCIASWQLLPEFSCRWIIVESHTFPTLQ